MKTREPVTLRLSADRQAILFFFRPEDHDPSDAETEGSFYDITRKEIESRGRQAWIDHLSRKNWFCSRLRDQFLFACDALKL